MGESGTPGRVAGVVPFPEVTYTTHVGEGHVALDDLLRIAMGQMHLGHDAVRMPEPVGKGL